MLDEYVVMFHVLATDSATKRVELVADIVATVELELSSTVNMLVLSLLLIIKEWFNCALVVSLLLLVISGKTTVWLPPERVNIYLYGLESNAVHKVVVLVISLITERPNCPPNE